MSDSKERPAYVRFETRAIEDRAASLLAGNAKTKDVDFVIITPVGTKDEIPREVQPWISDLKQKVQEGRLPQDHLVFYTKAYESWKTGQEVPVDGTPLKGWPVISPSQLANCLAANVRTVEDLALANGEALTRIGMGGIEMKQKAEAWLKASKDIGVVVQANNALSTENARLKATVKDLEEKNHKLAAELAGYKQPKVPATA